MLSDEEIKAVENLKTEYEKLIKEDNILFPLYKSDAKRLIDIIEKQSKEIEELKAKNEFLDWYFENQKENFVHKDKIKAKIEEIKKTHNGDDFNLTNVIMILQSLLEKE